MKFQLLLSVAMIFLSSTRHVDCKTVKVKVSYPHHEIHKHHVTKIPDLQIETVPIEKEIKVLVPYKVPYEVKVPYIVHQKVHTHVESKPIHTSHHIHHPPKKTHHHGHHEHSHHHDAFLSSSIPVSEHLFEDGKYFISSNGYAASDVAPLYISHHPVEHPKSSSHSPHSSTTFYDESGHIPQQLQQQRLAKIFRADLNDFTSTLHTSAFSPELMGFGSHEGQHQHQQSDSNDEFDDGEDRVEGQRYYEEFGPVLFKRKTKKVPATTTTTPKPPQKKSYPERSKKREKSHIHSEHPVGVGIPYKLRSYVRADEYEDEE